MLYEEKAEVWETVHVKTTRHRSEKKTPSYFPLTDHQFYLFSLILFAKVCQAQPQTSTIFSNPKLSAPLSQCAPVKNNLRDMEAPKSLP